MKSRRIFTGRTVVILAGWFSITAVSFLATSCVIIEPPANHFAVTLFPDGKVGVLPDEPAPTYGDFDRMVIECAAAPPTSADGTDAGGDRPASGSGATVRGVRALPPEDTDDDGAAEPKRAKYFKITGMIIRYR